MAKITETRFDSAHLDEVRRIEIVPPNRSLGWAWGALFAAFLMIGAGLGLVFASGTDVIQTTQAAFAANETGDTATN